MTAPTPQVRRTTTGVLVAVLVATLLSACGRAGDPQPVAAPPRSAGTEARTATGVDATLTTVAPLDEQYPELFNAQGCALGPITPAFDDLTPDAQAAIVAALPSDAQQRFADTGEIDLTSISPELLGAILQSEGTSVVDCNMSGATPEDPSEFYGYLGRNVDRFAPGEVDASAIGRSTTGWRAIGHAVAPDAGGTVTVTATLSDARGAVLDTVTATSPVVGARPSEPVPFTVSSDVDPTNVAAVDYTVTEKPGTANRSLTIQLEDVVANGDTSVILGSVTSASNKPIAKPTGIIAINDDRGNVIEIESFVVTQPGTTQPVAQLEPRFTGTFAVVVADPNHSLTIDNIEVWGFGS